MLDIQGRNSADSIKKTLAPYIGKTVKIKCNLGRNKYETFEATIKKIYNFLFLVEINGKQKSVKSFSYADVISKTIKISE